MQICVDLKQNSYNVYIDELKSLKFDSKVAIITNSTVGGLYLKQILSILEAKQVYVISIADGEQYKNLSTVEQILEQLFVSKLDRSSTIVALGGGVVNDISAFVASIYERGIKFISIPTTLLAQIDASVGGKTGINNKFGKNLIGTFYQPKAVYCESKFLLTLSQREFSAGLAEAVKMAVVCDKYLFEFLKICDIKNMRHIQKIIAKCVELKAKIVSKDEKENSLRAVLNYGHTFAHVIEKQTNYNKFLHGEAVSIGMNMANKLALKLGLLSHNELEDIQKLLVKFNLPVVFKIEDVENFYELFFLDKKSKNGRIQFVLPNSIGDYLIDQEVPKSVVIDVLEEFK